MSQNFISERGGLQLFDTLSILELTRLHESKDIRKELENYHPKLDDDTWSKLQDHIGQSIKGSDLFRLRPKDLREFGIPEEDQQILFSLTSQKASQNRKIFLDPVYGYIKLHPLLVKIIDSPEIQRLRHIKQLGGAYWVFLGASHNRFEHSIGACHLAGEVGKTLQEQNPSWISDKDILCLQIAALCHELGQGPFSRLFDRYVVPRILPRPVDGDSQTKHWIPRLSATWVEQLLKSDDIKDYLTFYGLCIEKDVKFIKLLVHPTRLENEAEERKQQQIDLEEVGRPMENGFLFQIVNNIHTDMDVDRWDYLARDSLYTGLKSNFDYTRLLKYMRILPDKSKSGFRVIAFRDKQYFNIDTTYHLKFYMYGQVYMHLPTMMIDLMIADALAKVSGVKIFTDGETNQPYSIQDAILEANEGHFRKYHQLTDSVYHTILFSTSEELRPGRELLERIEKRDLYKLVGKSLPHNQTYPWTERTRSESEDMCKRELLEKAMTQEPSSIAINGDNLIVKILKLGFGTQNQHPRSRIPFYTKYSDEIDSEKAPKPLAVNQFEQWQVRLFYTGNNNNEFLKAKKAFEEYCGTNKLKFGAAPPELTSGMEALSVQ